jgi:WD40 repeat protein
MPKPPSIFISYAHRDGSDLARRLKGDLDALGFDVWLDKHRLKAGDRWTNEIEEALDHAQVVLALLSEGSYKSDTCRAEQNWALDASRHVIPVKVQSNCRAQLRLYDLQHIDFSDPTNYAERLQQLQASLGDNRQTAPPPPPQPRYNNAPSLPDNFVARPELLANLRDKLFEESPQRNIALTALQGMGGIGKTVLAQALCRDAAVQHAFPDGIFWFTIGREARGFQQRVETVPGLNQLLGAFNGDDACISQYRNALRDKAALIVLDDVWNASDIEPFRTESPRSRLLITTRDAGIASSFGAREFTAELLADAEAREVLARWAGLQPQSFPPQAKAVIDECKNLPLALAMIGAQLKGKPARHWDIVLGYLRHADLASIKARFPEPHTSLFRAIEVSFEALREDDVEASQRYLALAVLLEDMAAAPAVQQTLWNVDEAEALKTSARFVDLSLAQRDQAVDGIRLHDLQLDYVRAHYPDQGALALIHGAVRLSAHVIEKHPREFASQVVGRLLPHRTAPAIQQFIDEISAGAPAPWLRPLHPALHPPGTPLLRTLEGHSDSVCGVVVTPDGKRAVSASQDNTLKVWDLDTGRALRTLKGHSNWVSGVAMTPDGKRAVSASWDNTLKVWDLDTGLELRTLEGHSNWVSGVAVTPDGKRAVSASRDNTLTVWDLDTGRALRTLEGHSYWVSGVVVTPDGKRAVSASGDKTLMVWDLDTGRALCTLEGHFGSVDGVAVTPDGKRAVSASADGTLMVWDLDTGRALRTLEGHFRSVTGVAVMPDGKRAVSASGDNTLKVWDLDTGRALRTLEGHSGSVDGVAVTPDGKRAVSASGDNTLKVWDLDTGRALRTLEGHSGYVSGVAVTRDGKRVVSASADKTLKVWDLDTGRALRTLEGHSDSVAGVAVTPDGKRAVSASGDKTLTVWDLDTGHALRTLEGHFWWVAGVAVTPDGKRAVSASVDKTLKVWDLEIGRALRTLEGHSSYVDGVAVTPHGKRAVSASDDKTLKVWDLESGRALRTLEGHSSGVSGVAVTPDGKQAVSASRDNTLTVWDLDTGHALRTLEGHSASVFGVALSPDGQRAVSASWDKTLKVWGLDTGLLIATFHCDGAARCCACVDNQRIVAGDDGGCVYILSLEESRLPENLTEPRP